jgi:hypothetical protein
MSNLISLVINNASEKRILMYFLFAKSFATLYQWKLVSRNCLFDLMTLKSLAKTES